MVLSLFLPPSAQIFLSLLTLFHYTGDRRTSTHPHFPTVTDLKSCTNIAEGVILRSPKKNAGRNYLEYGSPCTILPLFPLQPPTTSSPFVPPPPVPSLRVPRTGFMSPSATALVCLQELKPGFFRRIFIRNPPPTPRGTGVGEGEEGAFHFRVD